MNHGFLASVMPKQTSKSQKSQFYGKKCENVGGAEYNERWQARAQLGSGSAASLSHGEQRGHLCGDAERGVPMSVTVDPIVIATPLLLHNQAPCSWSPCPHVARRHPHHPRPQPSPLCLVLISFRDRREGICVDLEKLITVDVTLILHLGPSCLTGMT